MKKQQVDIAAVRLLLSADSLVRRSDWLTFKDVFEAVKVEFDELTVVFEDEGEDENEESSDEDE